VTSDSHASDASSSQAFMGDSSVLVGDDNRAR